LGIGDQIIATGVARGAAARGARIAFGDRGVIRWDHNSEPIFRGNPNIAFPGVRYKEPLEWVAHYKGERLYNRPKPDRWEWKYEFRVTPGEVFLSPEERSWADLNFLAGSIVMEPTIPVRKGGGYMVNKQWPFGRYQQVADVLKSRGYHVYQFVLASRPALGGVRRIEAPTFRHALAVLEKASLYVGTEGGPHHGAAAVGTPAVVPFGGWLPPSVLGYDTHINLTGGETEACGLFRPCDHCRDAMARISVSEVLGAALELLEERDHGAWRHGAISQDAG
jgi:hypothetical protein